MDQTPHLNHYRVIVSDNAWKMAQYGAKKHGGQAAAYPGLTLEELAAIPVGQWAAKDSILFQWTTWPKLEEAFILFKAWGFSYVTGCPWVKTTPSGPAIYCGIGFWFQSASEILLCGRKGKAKGPKGAGKPGQERNAEQVRGLLCGSEYQFYAPTRRPHSTKPLSFTDWVLKSFPGPYLELFARNKINGMTCWGTSLGYELGPWGVRECPIPAVSPGNEDEEEAGQEVEGGSADTTSGGTPAPDGN